MANKYRYTVQGWRETGCGCSGSQPTGPALDGIDSSRFLIWNQPIPSVVIGSDGSRYQVQGAMIILDLTAAAYIQFAADVRFRIPSEPEKTTLFGYKARIA